MALPLDDPHFWSAETAVRLRRVQSACATLLPSERQTFLNEEIGAALEPVPPPRRAHYLQTLLRQFPAWESLSGEISLPLAAPPAPAPAPAASVSVQEEVPPALALLLRHFTLPDGDDPEASRKLDQARQKMGVAENQPLDLLRTVKLLVAVLDQYARLHTFLWSRWKTLSPESELRPPEGTLGDILRYAGPYLAGDSAFKGEHLSGLLSETQRLVASLLQGMEKGVQTYAHQINHDFAPETIASMTGGGGFLASEAARCWPKYKERHEQELSESRVRNDLREAIVQAAETIYKTARR